jgi:hypothetical protein
MGSNGEKEKKDTTHCKLGITKSGFEILNRFIETANKDAKRRIKVKDVLSYAVEKLTERDIPKIQERVYTADDRMELMLEEYNSKHPGLPVTKEEFKAMMVETFEKQVLSKATRQVRLDTQLPNGPNTV